MNTKLFIRENSNMHLEGLEYQTKCCSWKRKHIAINHLLLNILHASYAVFDWRTLTIKLLEF